MVRDLIEVLSSENKAYDGGPIVSVNDETHHIVYDYG